MDLIFVQEANTRYSDPATTIATYDSWVDGVEDWVLIKLVKKCATRRPTSRALRIVYIVRLIICEIDGKELLIVYRH